MFRFFSSAEVARLFLRKNFKTATTFDPNDMNSGTLKISLTSKFEKELKKVKQNTKGWFVTLANDDCLFTMRLFQNLVSQNISTNSFRTLIYIHQFARYIVTVLRFSEKYEKVRKKTS